MKKSSVLLLTLISGLTLAACDHVSYLECERIQMGDRYFYSTKGVNVSIACQYKIVEDETNLGTKDYEYFFVTIKKGEKEPAFPQQLKIQYSYTDGDHGYRNAEFTKKIGKYESSTRIFVSKDEKKVRYESINCKPVDAPYDKEIENKSLFQFFPTETGEIPNTYSVGCIIYALEKSVIKETYDVDGVLEYKLLEK